MRQQTQKQGELPEQTLIMQLSVLQLEIFLQFLQGKVTHQLNRPAGWKFIIYDKTFTPTTAECVGTASFDYVGLIQTALILKSGSSYKMCTLNPMMSGTTIVFDLIVPTADFSTVTSFLPFTSNGPLYALVSDGTNSAVYGFTMVIGSSSMTGVKVGMKLNGVVLTSVHGSADVIYSHVSKGFIKTASNTADATTIDSTYTAVNSYLFISGNVLFTATTPAGTAGDIYEIYGTVITKLTYSGTTATPYLDFGDNIYNFARIGTTHMYWRHQMPTGQSTFIKANIPIAQINSGASGAIENVALSGDKAVILWSDKIIYLKITSDDTVKKVYETSTPGTTLTGEYQYILTLSCTCKQIKRFACFSSTLNCIIVKKGQDTCGTEDPFFGQA